MPLLGTYYIDGVTLSSSTSVYTDAGMTTPAPDGFYSDGSVVREQIGGVLSIVQVCPTCSLPCDSAISTSGDTGIYQVSYNLGSATGCVIVYFNAFNFPVGIRAQYNSAIYNKLTSITYGYLASTASPNNYTFLGDSSFDCGVAAALAGGGYSGQNVYVWDASSANFVLASNTGIVTGAAGDVQLTINPSGYCTLYFPKFTASPIDTVIEMFGPCASSVFEVEVNCPTLLTGVSTSEGFSSGADSATLCNTVGTYPNTYYNVPNYGGIAGCPQIHEFFVQDPYGNIKVPAGKYKIPAIPACAVSGPPSGEPAILEVDSNGVIVDIYVCPV